MSAAAFLGSAGGAALMEALPGIITEGIQAGYAVRALYRHAKKSYRFTKNSIGAARHHGGNAISGLKQLFDGQRS